MIKVCSAAVARSKWFVPSFCLVLGLVMLAVSWLGGSDSRPVLRAGRRGLPLARVIVDPALKPGTAG